MTGSATSIEVRPATGSTEPATSSTKPATGTDASNEPDGAARPEGTVAGSTDAGSAGLDTTLLRAGAKLVAPTAFLTAWLYYIGWVKTHRQASYFGVDPSLLDYSTTDYVLRSVTSLLGPAGTVLIGLLAIGAVRRTIHRVKPNDRTFRYFRPGGRLATGLGSALVIVGGLYLNRLGATGFASALAAVALLVGGVLLLLGRYLSVLVDRREDPKAGIDAIEILLIGLVLAVGLFAAGFFYAVQVGEFSARALEDRLADAPEVHLLSTQDLELGGSTTCEPLRAADSAYRCRYQGLRLLAATDARLFLIPERWGQAANSYVHIIPVTDEVRIDLRR